MTAVGATPARRAALFLGLAGALALVAVRAVAREEAEIRAQIGPVGTVVVVARDLSAGRTLQPGDLAYRTMPARWAPPRTLTAAQDAVGLRTVVALSRGTPLLQSVLTSTSQQASAALASGDRVIDLVAAASARLVRPGARVDVVAAESDAGGRATPRIVAEAVEVIEARAAESDGDEPRVAVTLRVGRREALALTAADSGDAPLRLLPRASWDREELAERP